MPTLLEKIEADATERLPLPPNRTPAQELARYVSFLKVETQRLKMLHRAGAGGREICHARAGVLDALLRHILAAVRQSQPQNPMSPPPRLALVAIGGYGRGELNPHSDIDIMMLHDGDGILAARGKLHPFLTALTSPGGLTYTLTDIRLKVGYSIRTVEDCVSEANKNMQSKTSLIEARLITGDETVFKRMQAVVLTKCVHGFEDDYIQVRLEDQETRRRKFGNSACMQEPNIKNGCGGLRDYQNLLWMAYFKYRTRTVAELHQKEFISQSEARDLDAAYDFLLRARNELHYHTDRAVDVLSKSVQPHVAHNLGYTDRSPSRRLEEFMRDFYTHTRNIDLITRTIEQRLALLPKRERLPSLRELLGGRVRKEKEQVVDGLRLGDGVIVSLTPRVFKEQPRRLMRVFLHAQQRGLKLHPDLVQLIRSHLHLVNRDFLQDPHVHETFREILGARGNVGATLRVMHEVDFLGKFLPEFGQLTCLVQHEFYHQYTADEHTLVCLEKLDQVCHSTAPAMREYAALFQQVERPFILHLALLLHDAGKAQSDGKHSEAGGKLAQRVASRLGLDASSTQNLRLLVEHHLDMAQISQRRDLDDPAVIRQFVATAQTTENLNALTLLTLADSLGTSDKLWNGFKDTLLWTLYRRASALLSGSTEFLKREEHQRELIAQEVRGLLPPALGDEEIEAHFSSLPARYFQIQSAQDIADDLQLVHKFMHLQITEEDRALEPVIAWRNEPDRGCTSMKICTWDRAGLFSKIAGSFTAAGLNILSAQVFTRYDGVILDTFCATDSRTGLLATREQREKFESVLLKSLTGHVDFAALVARQSPVTPLYQSLEGERIPTVIGFDNESSDTRTVIDIETEDRVGLLHTISQSLSELGLDISVAKITTEKGAAMDTFYVSERDGDRVLDLERQHAVEGRLRAAIVSLDAVK